jgi:hypothetical protein
MPDKRPKQKTLSGREWDGAFRPVVYRLSDVAWKLPLSKVGRDGSLRPTTVAEALRGLRRVRKEDRVGMMFLGQERFRGESFPKDLLRTLLRLQCQGVTPCGSEYWFFYDSSREYHEFPSRNAEVESEEIYYKFFVVANERIVLEDGWVKDSPNSGFDPAAFFEPGFWNGDNLANSVGARATYWYRKFYRETRAGQIMVLRPDKPELFHYAEGRTPGALGLASMQAALNRDLSKTGVALAGIERRLRTTNRFLLVLLALAILALVHFWG